MTIHKLKGQSDSSGNRTVWLDGKELKPERSQKKINHSPDGFAWGYGGSGAAQLALAILLELTGEVGDYQTFKWNVIAHLPQGNFETTFNL